MIEDSKLEKGKVLKYFLEMLFDVEMKKKKRTLECRMKISKDISTFTIKIFL